VRGIDFRRLLYKLLVAGLHEAGIYTPGEFLPGQKMPAADRSVSGGSPQLRHRGLPLSR
jgi:hypothetical protein